MKLHNYNQTYAFMTREGFANGTPNPGRSIREKEATLKRLGDGLSEEELEVVRLNFKRGSALANQLTVDEYVVIVRNMLDDPTYVPTANINQRETGPLPNLRKAKDIVKAEVGEAVFEQKYNANIAKRKKLKANEKLKADPEARERFLAKKAEIRRTRRVAKLGDKTNLTPEEKFINFQQSLITKQLNEKVRKNPDIILKNPILMEQLGTTVASDGTITTRKVTLNDIKNRGIFEIEHQRDIYKKGAMKDFPYNRNLILGPHNRSDGFKNTAEKFIENNPDSPKIASILKKAEDLRVTLQPNVPEGTFKTKGLGYKQIANPVDKFLDVAKGTVPEISQELGLTFYEKNLEKAKSGLGMKRKATGTDGPELGAMKGLGKQALNVLQVLGTPSAAAGFAGLSVMENLKEGKNLADAVVDKEVGIELLFPELAKKVVGKVPSGSGILSQIGRVAANPFFRAARAFTPVGAAITTAGLAKDYGRFVQSELARKEADPEGYKAEQEEQMGIAAADGGLIRVGYADGSDDEKIDKGRRRTIKILGGLASLPIIGRFFDIAKLGAPAVEKVAEKVAESGVPDYFWKLYNTIKSKGIISDEVMVDPRVERTMKYKNYKLEEGAYGDPSQTVITKVNDRGEFGYTEESMSFKKGSMDEDGFVGNEYEELTVRPDGEGKLKDVEDGLDDGSVDEILEEIGEKTKID